MPPSAAVSRSPASLRQQSEGVRFSSRTFPEKEDKKRRAERQPNKTRNLLSSKRALPKVPGGTLRRRFLEMFDISGKLTPEKIDSSESWDVCCVHATNRQPVMARTFHLDRRPLALAQPGHRGPTWTGVAHTAKKCKSDVLDLIQKVSKVGARMRHHTQPTSFRRGGKHAQQGTPPPHTSFI